MAAVQQTTPRGGARIDAYIADQPKALQPTLVAARALLDEGLPGASCAIKWNMPVWSGNGNVVGLMTYPDHANLAFFQGTRLPDPQRLLKGTGDKMRHVKLHAAKDLKDPAVKALVRSAWRLDQA